MVARIWRGWVAADDADEVAIYLRDVVLSRYASTPGNVSAYVLRRPLAGGVELTTWSVWECADAVPAGVDEEHRLLVARQTIPDGFEIETAGAEVVRAA